MPIERFEPMRMHKNIVINFLRELRAIRNVFQDSCLMSLDPRLALAITFATMPRTTESPPMTSEPTPGQVSQHADTLNALADMQQSIAYAVRRQVLADAERIIVEQEQEILRMRRAWPLPKFDIDADLERETQLEQSNATLRAALERLVNQVDDLWRDPADREAIDLARAALAVTSDGWIAVSERLPQDQQAVLFVADTKGNLCEPMHGRVFGGKYIGGAGSGFSVPGLTVNASHWMPSPAPPVRTDET